MVRVSPPSRSASSGEISELLLGRPDFDRYQNALLKCRGFIPMPEGPITRCPGTEMLGEIKDNRHARLMPFIFRDEDAVLLEWTSGWLRFWRNGAQVTDGGAPYEIETPYNLNAAVRLQSLQSNDRIYLAEGNQAPQRISRFAIDSWTIEETPFVNGPYKGQNIDRAKTIRFLDDNGTKTITANHNLFLAGHLGTLFSLRELDRTDVPLWSGEADARVGDVTFYDGRHYELVAFDDTTGKTASTPPTVNGNQDVIASGDVIWQAIEQVNSGGVPNWQANETVRTGDRRFADGWTIEVSGFDLSDRTTGVNPPVHSEGRALSQKDGPVWEFIHDDTGVVKITAVNSATIAEVEVIKTIPQSLDNVATYRWSEGAWSDVQGWPRAIGSFQQRHIYGGTPTDPRTIWTTVIGGTVDMQAGGLDDDGFSYILDSEEQEAGEIRWIRGASGYLHIGTTANEFFGRATDSDRAFSELTAKFDSHSSRGTAEIAPVVVDGEPIFVSKNTRRLIAQSVNAENGKFYGNNLTQIARHIFGPGVKSIVYQEEPIPIIWAVGKDGALVGLTYIPTQQVVGFHKHDLAGGRVFDIAVMPTADGLSEELYLQVERDIDGQQRQFLERMKAPFANLDGQELSLQDAWFVWCGKRYEGAAATIIDDLDHLEGETVIAMTNQGVFTDLVVSGGEVTLPEAVTSATIGLDASPTQQAETLDIVMGTPDGGDEGRKRAHRVTGVRVHESAGGKFQVVGVKDGKTEATKEQPLFNLNAFEDPALRNGVFEMSGHKGWTHQMRLRFKPEPGLPLTIISRTPTLMMTDS